MNIRLLLSLTTLGFLIAAPGCKTSGQVANGQIEEDPSGVVTVEGLPPDAHPTPLPTAQPITPPQQPSTNLAPPPSSLNSTPNSQPLAQSAAGTDSGPTNLPPAQELAMLRGKLEDREVMAQRERDAANARIAQLEENNRKLQEEMTRAGGTSAAANSAPTSTSNLATGPALLWQSAQKDMKAGNYEGAITPLSEIVRSYPKHELALPALMNVGVLQYQNGHYNDAAITFNQVIEKFPKKKEVSLAWYGQAAAFSKLKQPGESKLVFEEVVQRYPASDEAKSAKLIIQKKDTAPKSLFALASKHRSLRL